MLLRFVCGVYGTPRKTPTGSFVKINKLLLKPIRKSKEARAVQTISKNNNSEAERLPISRCSIKLFALEP